MLRHIQKSVIISTVDPLQDMLKNILWPPVRMHGTAALCFMVIMFYPCSFFSFFRMPPLEVTERELNGTLPHVL